VIFYSPGEEAVSQSVGVGFDTPVPLSRWKRHKQFMSWVVGVCGYTTGPPLDPAVVY